jgi:flagellar motility protein MotE (MotC chaperone)
MILDNNALQRVKNVRGQGGMSEEEQAEFNTALSSLTSSRFTEYYTMLDTYVGNFLEQCGLSGQKINLDFTRAGDEYTYRWTVDDTWKYKGPENDDFVPMTGGIDTVEAEFRSRIDEQRSTITSGNVITFDKLFINAIVKRLLLGDTPPADEIHVFIYQFNRKCPGLANQYIGNFQINNNTVREKLKKSIRETQNLTVATFTSVIRSEMKDKFNTQFKIILEGQLTEIEGYRTQIDQERDTLRQKTATREDKTTRQSQAASETTRASLQGEIDALTTEIAALESKIADLQDKIDDLVEDGETEQQRTVGTSKVEMPDLKILVQSKRSQDGKNILRMHVYDGKSKPNELQTFLSNLNNGFSIDARDLNLRSGDSEEEVITNRDARTALIEKLKEKGVLISRDTIDEYGVTSQKYVVNTQSHKLKHTIKDSMPSITYGLDGTAINKISMNMLSDDNIQAHFLLQTQNENTPNTNNSQTPGSQEDAQKIMPANLSIDLMGCPLLRYGQEYFVDFDTNTDLDNVYAMTKITHKISPGVFKTTAQLKPTFKGSVSFTGLISDVRFLNSPTGEETPAATATTPATAAAE